jgi:V/A-type H+-transporting ATPase subunit D
MKLKVNPNRMNLLKLRKRLKFAIKGYKLLKDKQEQLTKEFNNLIFQLLNLRIEIEKKIEELNLYLKLIHTQVNKEKFELWCNRVYEDMNFEIIEKKQVRFNVKYTEFVLKEITKEPTIFTTDPCFNILVKKLIELYPLILKLTNLEGFLELIAKELQTVHRRVNALEYILIPQLNSNIKYIINRLNELERTNIVQLIKIKSIEEK